MTIHTEIIPPSPPGTGEDAAASRPFDSLALYGYDGPPAQRYDGWTPERQTAFLRALSEGAGIKQACRVAGLSRQSAYAFRRSPRGAGFALAWQAAALLARDTLADELMDRAMHGMFESINHPDGTETTRHRYDNNLAAKMLARMDRVADSASREASHAAARLVAAEFEQFLDLIGRDAGPARAGLFLGARLGAEGVPAGEDDLAPVRALARADRWLRIHTDIAEPLGTADLDPERRAEWTGEQWARAEAAGLVQFAPPPAEPVETPESCQLRQLHGHSDDEPVWWNEWDEQWRTRFPPPEGFYGDEDGEYGQEDYSRELTADEEEAVEAPMRAEIAARRVVESAERDRWFERAAMPEEEAGAEADAAPFQDQGSPQEGGATATLRTRSDGKEAAATARDLRPEGVSRAAERGIQDAARRSGLRPKT